MFFELDPFAKKSANVYLQANTAELYDSVISNEVKAVNFFAINKIREYIDDLDGDTEDTHASVFIRLDPSYDIYERK